MGTRLYVGNLSFGVDDAGLYELFGAYGEVTSAQVMVDRNTGQAKGFAFVEMGTEEEAARAIEQANGLEHDGRVLTVNEARPKDGGPAKGSGGGSQRPSRWLSRIMDQGASGDGYRVESDGYVSAATRSSRKYGGK